MSHGNSQPVDERNGVLITIEGIDGSGKSTVVNRIAETGTVPGVGDVTVTREPTDSASGKLLRENLASDTADCFTELFLFMADHSTHLHETIRPGLEQGDVIVCDRYIDSRCAYQGHTLDGVVDDPMAFVYELHRGWSQFPHCTILLDIDAETAADRTTSGEKYEIPERLRAIRENYETLRTVDSHRFVVVDATQSKDAVFDDVCSVINDSVESLAG